jgi:hypothetical protein
MRFESSRKIHLKGQKGRREMADKLTCWQNKNQPHVGNVPILDIWILMNMARNSKPFAYREL